MASMPESRTGGHGSSFRRVGRGSLGRGSEGRVRVVAMSTRKLADKPVATTGKDMH